MRLAQPFSTKSRFSCRAKQTFLAVDAAVSCRSSRNVIFWDVHFGNLSDIEDRRLSVLFRRRLARHNFGRLESTEAAAVLSEIAHVTPQFSTPRSCEVSMLALSKQSPRSPVSSHLSCSRAVKKPDSKNDGHHFWISGEPTVITFDVEELLTAHV